MTASQDIDTFSYASRDDPRLKRFVIRLIERMTGQPYLRWLYDDYRNFPPVGESFWDSAIRRLELNVTCNEAKLATWPKTGPLVVVCNHPYGVLDGLVICHLIARVRTDFRILTNSVLYRADEIKGFLLPIDFAETEEAVKTNLKSRAVAKAHLIGGGCLVIFPAGGVSTTPTMWSKRAVDADWKTFTARMITQARAPVAPVFFAGQNSRLFQMASHISMTLRLSLLFKEVHDKIGSEIRVRIGDVVPYDALASITDRYAFMQHLRELTYALGVGVQNPPKPRVKRPKRAPKHGRPFPHARGAR
ncbi:MAG: lysophospholipid acyltransferase family protein [Alphaproteobacteria bacterium]|nr:lysophospholipid acyltransferase family protein [Alphaproteobacteria bacterium]MDE2630336.1 lysophospholipid acyltransferase family protein [Alphaproteobacteria bacterium]